MKKRVLSMLLAICMVVGLLPGMALGTAAAEPAEEMTIYFQNNWLWTDVCFYYWGSAGTNPTWPGEAMEKVGNDGTYDIYKITVPTDVTGIIVNGIKNDGSGSRDQTPDITSGWYDGICYYMLWDNGNTVGSENIDTILPPPAAPNVDNADNAIYVFVCNTKLPSDEFHQPIGVAFDSIYSEAGEPVKNADGKWIAEVTCQVKAMWENHTSMIYEYNYPDYAHTPHDELPETLTVTLTWDSEAEKWVYDNDDIIYDISCASAESSYVAEVDGQGFETLAEAIAHAQTLEGSTVKLLQNVSLDTYINITGGKFTIDLNGFVWESSSWALYIQNAAEVTLTSGVDGGVIRCTEASNPTVQLLDTAKLEISGGTVEHAAEGVVINTSNGGHPTETRLLISGGKVTTNGSVALWAFGSAVTVTGGILESGSCDIEYFAGSIDLSEHPDPTGIVIAIGYTITEAIVGTDILLPAGYCLMDNSTGEPATTLVTYGFYTVAAEPATPEPAAITGVSLSGNGVIFDAETNTYYVYADATDITMTVTGTNFANLTMDYHIQYAAGVASNIYPGYMTVDTENNIATDIVSADHFAYSDGFEICYSTDNMATWTGLGVYVTYVDPNGPVVNEVRVNTDSPAYDAETNTFTITAEQPLVITLIGENLSKAYDLRVGISNLEAYALTNVESVSDTEASITFTLEDILECKAMFEEYGMEATFVNLVVIVNGNTVQTVELNIAWQEVTYGDVTGDAQISLVDVLRLRRYLAACDPITGESAVEIGPGADVNGDGQISLADVLLLRQYLSSRDPVTGESPVVLGPQ